MAFEISALHSVAAPYGLHRLRRHFLIAVVAVGLAGCSSGRTAYCPYESGPKTLALREPVRRIPAKMAASEANEQRQATSEGLPDAMETPVRQAEFQVVEDETRERSRAEHQEEEPTDPARPVRPGRDQAVERPQVVAQGPRVPAVDGTGEEEPLPRLFVPDPESFAIRSPEESAATFPLPPPPAEEVRSRTLPDLPETVLVDFHDILSLASGRNPQVHFANERIREAFAELEQADLLWLPSLRAGTNYHYHSGTIQSTRGEVLDISRNSLFGGMASRVVGGGSVGVPGIWMQFHLTDALFQPRIAEQTAGARQSAAQTALNDTLLEVSLAYLRLLERLQEQAIALETFQHADQLAELTRAYAEAGLAPQADADRALTERALRENLVQRSQEEIEVASTELVRLLNGDPSLLILPRERTIVPIELVEQEADVRNLLATGFQNRPELQENRALVCQAIERLNREKYSPFLPNLLMGASYGTLGGGIGSRTGDFGDRFDFDVAAWWEVRQLGFGERAVRDGARSRLNQANWRQVQLVNQVAQEISAAHAQIRARENQMQVARGAVEFALDSYRRNQDRIQLGEGLPIEALQAVQALDAARREYLRALVSYNEAQFRMYRSLGWPIDGWPRPSAGPDQADWTHGEPP